MQHTDSLIGQVFGRFRLERKIGEGGMGSVYEARRISDFEQIVAVKVLLQDLHRADTLRRFRTEQQALAALQHPHIVSFIDGGVTSDGVPYLVMDYVDGVPLDEYCRVSRLNVRDRVQLMVPVLDAIQHAHSRLFVHCDLKFSNILVTASGEPKLLDFGVAKLLNPEHYGIAPHLTQAAARPFTPDFASPEQLRGDPLVTATDVYSMGVILYWLLTGTHPFESLRNEPIALLKAVCESTPEFASRRLASIRRTDATQSDRIVEERSTTPSSLESALHGDVDHILDKALRKEPEERYASAARFSEDLRRFLDHRPVEAHAPSRLYRARKFIQRNSAAAALAAIVLFVALAGVVSTLWQNYRAQRSHTIAERRFSEARKLTNTLLFDLYDSLQKLPGSTPSQVQLVNWALDYLDSLSRQGMSDPGLPEELSEAYRRLADLQGNPYENNLGKPKEALATIDRGLQIIDPVLAADPHRRSALVRKARLLASKVEIQLSTGAMDQALADKRVALAILDDLVQRYPRDYEVLMDATVQYETLGDMLSGGMMNVQDVPGAIKSFERARELGRRAVEADPSQDRPKRSQIIVGMKLADQIAATDPQAAVKYFEQTREQYRNLPDGLRNQLPTRRIAGSLLRRYGWVLVQVERPEDALQQYEESATLLREVARIDPTNLRGQWDLAVVYKAMAEAEEVRGEPRLALAAYRKVIALLQPHLNESMPLAIRRGIGEAFVRMGSLEAQLGDLDAARASTPQGLRILLEQIDSADTPATEIERTAEALLVAQPREFQDTVRARDLLRKATSNGTSGTGKSLALVAEAEWRSGSPATARDVARKALETLPETAAGPYRAQMQALLARN